MAGSAKMQPTGADADTFLAEIPDPRRQADARTLVELLSELTGAEPVIWAAGIVGFGSYRYRYPSGHEGTAPLACFAARRDKLVIYLAGGFEERHGRLVQKLGPHKSGKGCLYLKRLDEVDLGVLRDLVDRSIRIHRGQDRAATSEA